METEGVRQISYIPEEIMTDILLKLPVKSLFRFKFTSKSWRSLISSKFFVETHLENSTKNPTSAHHRMVSVHGEPYNYELHHCSLRSVLFEPVAYAVPGDFSIHESAILVKFAGCCNGLVCILINNISFILWNPSTRESKKLPEFGYSGMKNGQIYEYGFAFDESSRDYKVYGLLRGRCMTKVVKTYSLKTDSWKSINNFRGDTLYCIAGKFVNGKLHWTRKDQELDSEYFILSFDISNEIYGTMELPDVLDYNRSPTLGVSDGCLSALYHYRDRMSFDLWVLKKYGMKNSWSKLITVSNQNFTFDGLTERRVPYHYVMSSNGLFLFSDGDSTNWIRGYNLKENRLWDPKIVGLCNEFLYFDVYVESLVPIDVDAVGDYY